MRVTLPPYAIRQGIACGPSAPQRAFHLAPAFYRYMRGGLGSGKSLAGSRDFLMRIMSNAEWLTTYNQTAPKKLRRGLRYLAGAPSYDLVEAGAWHHCNDWFEQFAELNGWSLVDRVWESEPKRIRLRTRDELRFVSLRHPKGFAGVNATGAWLDEAELGENPMAAFQALNKRLRDTAVPSDRWFLIVTSTNEGFRGVSAHFETEIGRGNDRYALIKAPTSSNPGASKSYIENLTAGMTKREVAELVEGETEPEEGAVFRFEYDRVQSVIEWTWLRRPRKGCEYHVAIDWGGHYHALLIEHYPLLPDNTQDPLGGVDVVFDEVVMDGQQDGVFLDAVMDRLRSWNLDPNEVTAWADYNPVDAVRLANSRRYFPGKCYSRRIGDTRTKRRGIKVVRRRLQTARGERRLYFAERLKHTKEPRRILACMDNYSYAKRLIDGQSVLMPDVNQESPWGHGPDALRAYCWQRYDHVYADGVDERPERA